MSGLPRWAAVEHALDAGTLSELALCEAVAPLCAARLLAVPRPSRRRELEQLPEPLRRCTRAAFQSLRRHQAAVDAGRSIGASVPAFMSACDARAAASNVVGWGFARWWSERLSTLDPRGAWLAQRWNLDAALAAELGSWWDSELEAARE